MTGRAMSSVEEQHFEGGGRMFAGGWDGPDIDAGRQFLELRKITSNLGEDVESAFVGVGKVEGLQGAPAVSESGEVVGRHVARCLICVPPQLQLLHLMQPIQ